MLLFFTNLYLFGLLIVITCFDLLKANPQLFGYQQTEMLNDRVHQVATFVDETALLPCEVDFKNCGEIYFITWSKNISNEWLRVYLYSKDYQIAMGEFVSEDGRVSLEDSEMTTSGLAYLRINSLSVMDEGTFKCDVTYVHGKCPSLTYIKLYALAIPKEPLIRINGKVIESGRNFEEAEVGEKRIKVDKVGPLLESSSVSLECESEGGNPLPEVKWLNESKVLRSKTIITKYDNDKTKRVTSSTRLIVSRNDLGSKFECRVENNATKVPLSKWISLVIHVKPVFLRVKGPSSPVVEGEMISFSCTVDGALPPATIVWFNRSEMISPHPISSTELMSDGTFRTSSTLIFIASRYDHSGQFFCKGTNEVLKSLNEVPLLEAISLQVLYPPKVTMDLEGRVAINESDSIKLGCSVDANPPNVAEIIWIKDGQVLDTSSSPWKIFNRFDQHKSILTLTNVNPDQSGFYSCNFKNSFGTGNASALTYLDVWTKPVVKLELDPSVVTESADSSVLLKCLAIGGNPRTLIRVNWFRNGQIFETSLGETASILRMKNITRFDHGNYSCQGSNGFKLQSLISSAIPLKVEYTASRAVIKIGDSNENVATKGSSLTLKCWVDEQDLGNPPATSFSWLHQGKPIKDALKDVHHIPSLSVSQLGNYSCAAVNRVGVGKYAHFYLKAKTPPRLIRGLAKNGGVLRDQSLLLSCQIECQPMCSIDWKRNEEVLRSFDSEIIEVNQNSENQETREESLYYHIKTRIKNQVEEDNTLTSVISYLRIKNTTWIQDNDTFTCESLSEGFPPVRSSMVYKVEYPPQDIEITSTNLKIFEGDSIKEHRILCKAAGHPEPSYLWKVSNTGHVISFGPNLFSNRSTFKLSRKHAGNYTCTAANKHGSASANFSLVVLYEPDCQIRKDYFENIGSVLICETESYPPVLNYTWLKSNQTIGSDDYNSQKILFKHNLKIKSNYLLLPDNEDLESFACIARNLIGASSPCKIESHQIGAQSGWAKSIFKDEKLIIIMTVVCILILLLVSSLFIFRVCSQNGRLRRSDNSNYHESENSWKQQNINLLDKINYLEDRSGSDGHCSDTYSKSNESKSPYIVRNSQTTTLRSVPGTFQYSHHFPINHRQTATTVTSSPTSFSRIYKQSTMPANSLPAGNSRPNFSSSIDKEPHYETVNEPIYEYPRLDYYTPKYHQIHQRIK